MEHTVTELGKIVITAFREVDYQASTIGIYRKTIRRLNQYANGENNGLYNPELGAKFAADTTSPRTEKFSA